jgi:hypothetical protein
MSALGQKQTYALQKVMSALPRKRPQKRISEQGHVGRTPESERSRYKIRKLWDGRDTPLFKQLIG